MTERNNENALLFPFRVLDLADEKGFLCGRILGDLGADVIKIEPPGGDLSRNIGPFYHDIPDPEKSLHWFAFNNNKRGITLNLETKDGREIFKSLVKKADFVIESFSPGYMSRLDLSYDSLSKINPRIIMTSITPFGQNGPYRDYKASDIVTTAMSGLMYLTGDPGRPPVRISFPQSNLHAGAEAAAGSMLAHYHRELTGEGQWVDVSAQDTMNELTMGAPWNWDLDKEFLHREGPFRGGISMGGRQPMIWKSKDGYISFLIFGGILASRTLEPIVKWMDSKGMAPNFMKEKDWAAFDIALSSQEEINRISEALDRFFVKHTTKELYEGAADRSILFGPVTTIQDIFEDPQLEARSYWQELEHPELDTTITYPGGFIKLSESSCQIWRRAPLIGEHNQEIYQKELGFSSNELVLLKEAGVI